jgi:hypothetical protein
LAEVAVVSVVSRLLAALAALVAVVNYVLAIRSTPPDPLGSDNIVEGPASRAKRLRAAFRKEAIWAVVVAAMLLGLSVLSR